jgi:hypothetical protein
MGPGRLLLSVWSVKIGFCSIYSYFWNITCTPHPPTHTDTHTHTHEKRRFIGISFVTHYEAHFPLNEQKIKDAWSMHIRMYRPLIHMLTPI